MKLLRIEKVALSSIFRNRSRSLLTSLGIIIGVCSVIVMVAVGEGSQKKIETDISSMGTNLLMIRPGSSSYQGVRGGAGSRESLTMDDCETLREQATLVQAISPSVSTYAQIIGGSGNWNCKVEGVSPEYLEIRNFEIEQGTMFNEKDIASRKKVAVIGKTIEEELFPSGNAVGQKLRINNTPFTIIGVLAEKGNNSMGMDQDDFVLAPSMTVLYRLKGGKYGSYVNMIYVSAVSDDVIDEAEVELTTILLRAHKIDVEDDADFTIRSQSEITDFATSTASTLTLLLGAIAGVSLIVGGIGIMNIMLVSVTERTREIGIRISVGARTNDVLLQFLAEAITLSLIGGILGLLFAMIITMILSKLTSLTPMINPAIAFIAFIFSGAVGIFFGYYPAKKASELNPIDALHYE